MSVRQVISGIGAMASIRVVQKNREQALFQLTPHEACTHACV